MSRFDDVRSIVRSLGPSVYRNSDRVVNDAIACLQNVPFLEPKALQMTRNDGSASTLLALDGTIQTYYGGASYQTPVCIYIPEPYPDYPPIAYLRPTRDMFVVPGHRFADANGLVYLPYLSEWRPMYSNIVELIGVMVSVFSEMPPLRSRPPEMPPGPAIPLAQNPYPVQQGIAPGPVGAYNGPPGPGRGSLLPAIPPLPQQQPQLPPQPQTGPYPSGVGASSLMPQLNPFGIPTQGGAASSSASTMPQYPPRGSSTSMPGGPAGAMGPGPAMGVAAGAAAVAGGAAAALGSMGSPGGINSSSSVGGNALSEAQQAANAKQQRVQSAKDEKAEKIREITAYLQSKLADMLRSTGKNIDTTTAAQEQLEKRGAKAATLIEDTRKGVKELEAYQAALDKQIRDIQLRLAEGDKTTVTHVRAPTGSLGGVTGGSNVTTVTTGSSPLADASSLSLATSESSGGGFSANRPPSLDVSDGGDASRAVSKQVLVMEDIAVASSRLQQQLMEAVAEDSAIEDCYFYLEQLLNEGRIELKAMLVEVRELSRRQFRARYLARKIDAALAADRKAKLAATGGASSSSGGAAVGGGGAASLTHQASLAGPAMMQAMRSASAAQQPQQQPYYPSIGR